MSAAAPALRRESYAVAVAAADPARCVPGRNTAYPLALRGIAPEQGGTVQSVQAPAAGIDGTRDYAGAIMTADTLRRARALGVDPAAALADHDSYGFFPAPCSSPAPRGPRERFPGDSGPCMTDRNSER